MSAPLQTRPALQDSPPAENEFPAIALTLMQSRQTVLPKRLAAPGPDGRELEAILASAGTAPDHGQLLPWRLILIPQSARAPLGEVFGAALMERDAAATREQVACLLLVTVDGLCGDPQIDLMERTVATGCAIQNMLLMATALGYGSALTSGKALKSAHLRTLFGLNDGEHALCFLSIGTAGASKGHRLRPQPADYVRTLFD